MANWVTLLRNSGVPVQTREQWEAKYRYSANSMGKPRYAFLHITVTNPTGNIAKDSQTVERIGIQRFPNTGISYTALVHQGGTVCIGQPDGRRGAHTLNDKNIAGFPHNLNAVGDAISFVANVQHAFTEKEAESVARYFAARQLAGVANYDGKIRMHRDFAWKECPGTKAMAWITKINQKYTAYVKAGKLPGGTVVTPPGEEEFIVRAEDKAEFQQWVANGVLQALRDSPSVKGEFTELVGIGVHGQRLGKSDVTIGMALQTAAGLNEHVADIKKLIAGIPVGVLGYKATDETRDVYSHIRQAGRDITASLTQLVALSNKVDGVDIDEAAVAAQVAGLLANTLLADLANVVKSAIVESSEEVDDATSDEIANKVVDALKARL